MGFLTMEIGITSSFHENGYNIGIQSTEMGVKFLLQSTEMGITLLYNPQKWAAFLQNLLKLSLKSTALGSPKPR